MSIEVKTLLEDKDKDMFEFLEADEVHPHDYLLEKTFLRFIPLRVTPNFLTALRLILTPVVFLLVLYQIYDVGIGLFLLTAFTDALDGSMARTRDQITRFGMLFDPLVDKILIGSMILLIVFDNYSIYLAGAVLGIEIVFILAATIAKVKFKTVKMANIWGKIKMLLQVIAVFLTLAGLLLNTPQFFTFGAWVFGVAIGFAILSLFSQGI
jgi:CDP-diacylglycerol--glycerol-3-phosphate 3-phosphatidyltransferase